VTTPRRATIRPAGSPQDGRIDVYYLKSGEARYRAYYRQQYIRAFETRAEAQRAIEGKRVEIAAVGGEGNL